MRCVDPTSHAFTLPVALLLAVSCAAPEPPAPIEEIAAAPGRIVGRVLYDNGGGAAAPIDMSADPLCAALHDDPPEQRELLLDEEGRMQDVLVYLSAGVTGGPWDPPAEPKLLDQVGCIFLPRVQALRTGQKMIVRNSDPTLHNVNANPVDNPVFNFGQPFQGMETELVFSNAETVFRVRCDTHPWMAAYVAVFDHPFYAVTGGDGAFALEDVPPGEYTLRAWHERLGTRDLPVRVTSGDLAEIEILFQPEGRRER